MKPGGDFAVRVWSSLILIPIALIGAWWGSWPAYVLSGVVAAIVFLEWALVVDRATSLVPDTPEVATGVALVVLAALTAGGSGPLGGVAVALLGALGVALLSRSGWLAGGCLYAALLGVSLAAVRSDDESGLKAMLLLLVVVWASDTFAFFAGRLIGGPKLWPRVSPKKTWSGTIGGLVGGVAASAIVAMLVHIPVTAGLLVMLAALAIASMAGDLFESAVKRRFHKKDSSGMIPGHGGMMDRVDGLLFAAVLTLIVGWIQAGPDAIGRGAFPW